jgi:hypothetical protein
VIVLDNHIAETGLAPVNDGFILNKPQDAGLNT